MHTVNIAAPCPTPFVNRPLIDEVCLGKVLGRLTATRSLVRQCSSGVHRPKLFRACRAQAVGSPTIEKPQQSQQSAIETDVVVIGSGIGGLCCAALLAKYGLKVCRDQLVSLCLHDT